MGAAQALALIPGVSRSGATISMGRFLGFEREAATRFAFLLAIPAVVGAGLFELKEIPDGDNAYGWGPTIAATVVSFVVGYAAIAWLLRYVSTRSYTPFVRLPDPARRRHAHPARRRRAERLNVSSQQHQRHQLGERDDHDQRDQRALVEPARADTADDREEALDPREDAVRRRAPRRLDEVGDHGLDRRVLHALGDAPRDHPDEHRHQREPSARAGTTATSTGRRAARGPARS